MNQKLSFGLMTNMVNYPYYFLLPETIKITMTVQYNDNAMMKG